MLMQKLVLIAPLVTQAVLYVLMGLSVLSIAIIIERWWFFARRKADMTAIGDGLRRALHKHDVVMARELLRKSRSVEAEITLEALDWYGQGPEAIEQIIPKAIRTRRKKMEAGLVFLGTLGNNAPFIGLFGTVLGIVTGFHELGATTAGGAGGAAGGMNNVMAAIGEALLATAIGILVAIPAVVAFNIFSKKGVDVEENAHSLGNVILANLRSVGGAPLPEPATAPRAGHNKTTKPAASNSKGGAEAGA